MSTVTRSRSHVRNARASCPAPRLSASGSSSLSPAACASGSGPSAAREAVMEELLAPKDQSAGNLTLGNGNAGRTDVKLGGTEEEVVDVGLAAGRLMNVKIKYLYRTERASVEEKATV